jgi:NADH:ubiquinone oxidoreductase subunit C
MEKIETNLENLVSDIEKFYDYKVWEFLTLNGVKIDEETTEIQYIFSKYNVIDEVVIYYAYVKKDEIVPSIVELIPSAIISQREIVDMFGIEVEGSEKGLYLDEDSLSAPLSTCGLTGSK